MAECPITIGDPAVNAVAETHAKAMQFADQAFSLTTQQVGFLDAFRIEPYDFQISFDLPQGLTEYQRPQGVADPDIEYTPVYTFKDAPVLVWPTDINLDPIPVFDGVVPTIVIPSPPSVDIPAPPDAPVLTDVVIPTAPDIDLPTVPTLRDIVIPADPTIMLPTFNGITPVRDFNAPDFDFDFDLPAYTSALLDATRARIQTMLAGGTGLPPAIEQALFDRAAVREDVNDLKAIQTANEEVSCRGFQEPNGILARRMAEARQANRNARSQLVRDNLIDMRKTEIENIRFAVEKGIALETVLQDLYIKQNQLLLDAVKARADLEQKLLDARIAILQLDATIFQALAQVFRDLLQGELAKLEIFKAELDARRLIGEINQRDIDLYLAKLKGVESIIDIFKAQIDAANAVSANNNSKAQVFATLMQGRSEEIRALGFEFDAYKTQIDGENTKATIYESESRAYAAKIQAYSTLENTRLEVGRFKVEENKAKIESWFRTEEDAVERLKAEALTVTTKLEVFRGLLDRMKAFADIETSASQANQRSIELAISAANDNAQIALKNVDLRIDQNEKISGLLLEAMRTAATVSAQLAGSSLSALNASAHIGHDTTQSSSCTTVNTNSEDG